MRCNYRRWWHVPDRRTEVRGVCWIKKVYATFCETSFTLTDEVVPNFCYFKKLSEEPSLYIWLVTVMSFFMLRNMDTVANILGVQRKNSPEYLVCCLKVNEKSLSDFHYWVTLPFYTQKLGKASSTLNLVKKRKKTQTQCSFSTCKICWNCTCYTSSYMIQKHLKKLEGNVSAL